MVDEVQEIVLAILNNVRKTDIMMLYYSYIGAGAPEKLLMISTFSGRFLLFMGGQAQFL